MASANPPGDPGEPFDYMYIIDAESDSLLQVSTDFGAECSRHVRSAAPGRDVNALFDQIIASARVQLDAEPHLTATTPSGGGVVTLRWVGGTDDATRWEYRLHGPHPIGGEGPRPEAPWGRWTEVPGSDGDTRSYSVSGLPEGTAWVFQVRAVAGSVAGAPSVEALGGTAVVGPDGIPQLHGYCQWAEGGRTWRLGDSPTVIDVPVGLVVHASPSGRYSDGQISVSEQSTGDWILVDVQTATELSYEGGIVASVPPCGVGPAGHWQLFEHMRAALRLQPITQ